jgi:hypothetical protein
MTLNNALKNFARGGAKYRYSRHRIFHSVTDSAAGDSAQLSTFLRDKLFRLEREDWVVLSFDEKDWEALERIKSAKFRSYEGHYLSLLFEYIAANSNRVQEMYKKCALISQAARNDDAELFSNATSTFDSVDEQSLLYLRVRAAQFSYSAELLEKHLKPVIRTGWAQTRFLYPLIYHALNAPVESGLDNFLSYVITGYESSVEKIALKFLLRDDLSTNLTLGFKSYLGLLCHPYDACEQILNHAELSLCQKDPNREQAVNLIETIADIAPSARAYSLIRTYKDTAIVFSQKASPENLMNAHGFEEQEAEIVAKFVDCEVEASASILEGDSYLFAPLIRMRKQKYPTPSDFDHVTLFARQWWFCDSGRLVTSLLTTLYMVTRRETAHELRCILRLVGFLNQLVPFFLMSPSGNLLLQDRYSNLRGGMSAEELEVECDKEIREPDAYSDRVWIKSVHWQAREYQQRLQMRDWLEEMRRHFRVKPAYLTGINWDWLRAVIAQQRLRAFIGNPAGLFVLLLQKIEEQDSRSELLRVTAEDFAEDKDFEEFLDWLIKEYNDQAVAFVRYLLMPDDILLLGLAPNKTAAVTARVNALRRCAREYNYSDILPEELFRREWETLNSTLLLMSVNAGQFEIPWQQFQKDVASKLLDLYTASKAFDLSSELPVLMSEAKTRVPVQFRNGKIQEYQYPNKLVPMASMVFSVIDSFLEHPSFGLEVLLSTRFRHDTMRREFAATIEETSTSIIPSVIPRVVRSIVQEVEEPILDVVDEWLGEYMHSNRPEQPNGLFDVIPNQEQFLTLMDGFDAGSNLDTIIERVSRWLRDRLEEQLPVAAQNFETDIRTAFESRCQELQVKLLSSGNYRDDDVIQTMAALLSNLQRRTNELVSWFDCNSGVERQSLTITELKYAADLLFESFKRKRKYNASLYDNRADKIQVPPEKVRVCFDLLREVFASGVKHSDPRSARIRIAIIQSDDGLALRFSNLTKRQDAASFSIKGHPYKSLSDVVFREGDSGLSKIASMSATMCGAETDIRVHQKNHSFHLDVFIAAAAFEGVS